MPNNPFVDVGDLPSLGPLRYLDVRYQASFDAGHAPGAVRVPLDEWDAAAKAADTGFAKTAYRDRALNALGVDPTLTAVTYDGGGMTNAACVWFIQPSFVSASGVHAEHVLPGSLRYSSEVLRQRNRVFEVPVKSVSKDLILSGPGWTAFRRAHRRAFQPGRHGLVPEPRRQPKGA
jgi:hypothetical protein